METEYKPLNVKKIPADLHTRLKVFCAQKNERIYNVVLAALDQYLPK